MRSLRVAVCSAGAGLVGHCRPELISNIWPSLAPQRPKLPHGKQDVFAARAPLTWTIPSANCAAAALRPEQCLPRRRSGRGAPADCQPCCELRPAPTPRGAHRRPRRFECTPVPTPRRARRRFECNRCLRYLRKKSPSHMTLKPEPEPEQRTSVCVRRTEP